MSDSAANSAGAAAVIAKCPACGGAIEQMNPIFNRAWPGVCAVTFRCPSPECNSVLSVQLVPEMWLPKGFLDSQLGADSRIAAGDAVHEMLSRMRRS